MDQTAPAPIFFASDFGLADAYVGIVKAVILTIAPSAQVIDLGHELPPQDVRCGAYQLYGAAPYLPRGAVVLGVIDPGVGSSRRAIVVVGERCTWVAPDNGLLQLAFEHDPPRRVFSIESSRHRLTVSATFHGRDVFGPAAAHLASGTRPKELGPEIATEALAPLGAGLTRESEGEVLTFDRYGNAITTLRTRPGASQLQVAGRTIPLCTHYAEVGVGETLALTGSAGLFEVSVRNGNARAALGLAAGDRVQVS